MGIYELGDPKQKEAAYLGPSNEAVMMQTGFRENGVCCLGSLAIMYDSRLS